MRWLVACFEPFADARANASAVVSARLAALEWAGRVEFARALPVTFADAWPTLRDELARRPDVRGVVTLGQAAGRRQLDLECLALNMVDTTVPDNAGVTPRRGRLTEGPDVRWGDFAWERLQGIPHVARSYSAGTFVCNHVFYESLAWADEEPGRRASFVHVPALESQGEFAHLPRLAEDVAAEAAREILRALIEV